MVPPPDPATSARSHSVGLPPEEQSKRRLVKRGSRMAVNVVRPSREGAAGPPLAGGPASRITLPAWCSGHCWTSAEKQLL